MSVDQDDSAQPALDRDEVAKVAQLAMLELTEADLDRFTGQLGAVLDRAKELQAFDVTGVPPTAQPYPLVNVFRPDEPTQPADVRDEALAAAPEAEQGQFKVPPALGEAP